MFYSKELALALSVNIYARHINLDGDERYPREARYAPNGDPFTHHVFFDFK